MSAFFSLPVKTSTGECLSHEEVVSKLDDETVHYEIEQGMQGQFSEMLRIGIDVEKTNYEHAIRWLKDLIFGAEFDIARSVKMHHIILDLLIFTEGYKPLVQRSSRASQKKRGTAMRSCLRSYRISSPTTLLHRKLPLSCPR